jgi:Phosphomannose isomerase
MKKALPFLLSPAPKDYLWGGTRLKSEYGKQSNTKLLAETWECSTHPDGQSIVSSGQFQGLSLGEVLKIHPEYLGTHSKGNLPILIKFIDANSDLSIQVHPDDYYAKKNEDDQLGKAELWYILHADKNAKIIYGFQRKIDKKQLEYALTTNAIEKYLQYIPVKKDDVYFIEPGLVHAIGAGIVIVEIQESSNLTYRLFDYNRHDQNGNKRELHIKKALDVINLDNITEPKQPMRLLNYFKGYASELLCRCKYFKVERILLNTERYSNMADFCTGRSSFQVLLCIKGCGVLFGENIMINFFKGDCIFIPSQSVSLKLHGQAQMLNIGC